MDELSCFGFLVRCFWVYLLKSNLMYLVTFHFLSLSLSHCFSVYTLCVICLLVCSPHHSCVLVPLCSSVFLPVFPVLHLFELYLVFVFSSLMNSLICPCQLLKFLFFGLSSTCFVGVTACLSRFTRFFLLDDSLHTLFESHDTNLFSLRGNKYANKWLLLAYVRVQRSRLGFAVKERAVDE